MVKYIHMEKGVLSVFTFFIIKKTELLTAFFWRAHSKREGPPTVPKEQIVAIVCSVSLSQE